MIQFEITKKYHIIAKSAYGWGIVDFKAAAAALHANYIYITASSNFFRHTIFFSGENAINHARSLKFAKEMP